MQVDRFTKACLFAIVVLLTIFLVKPVFEPRDSYASKNFKYKVTILQPTYDNPGAFKKLEDELNKLGAEGWEVILYSEVKGETILIRR